MGAERGILFGFGGHLKNLLTQPSPVSLRARILLGWGKVRRLFIYLFLKKHLERLPRLRSGECGRCGACCKLLYRCPYLEEDGEGKTKCIIHEKRPPNCRIFPMDLRDIRDRDLIMPHKPCAYTFEGIMPRSEMGEGRSPSSEGG